MSLENQHRVAIAVKVIAVGNGLAIGRQNSLAARERRHEHQELRPRQMEIGNQAVHQPEVVAGPDEELRLPARCLDAAIIPD